ncbi:MAG: helix-turn-helix transcriptional regulator [Candidatus Aminicenantes bacterium]|nr:helix-turn-helix transcriptional regulator [Candidatus Aminicenantes bacterium]
MKVSGPTLSELEKGKYKPGHDLFYNISKEFNVNLNFLLFGEGEMFLDPIKETASRLESFAVNNEEVRKFLHYFEKSKILQFRILSHFNTILIEEQPIIEKEIEGKKNPGDT